jgi:hypothetical protein
MTGNVSLQGIKFSQLIHSYITSPLILILFKTQIYEVLLKLLYLSIGYHDIGDPICECKKCGSFMWYEERKGKSKGNSLTPKFQLCCCDGKVELPLLRHAPPILQHLLFDSNSPESKNFQEFTRVYNAMFSFTSPGMKIDERNSRGRGPPTLRIQGQTCHRMGTLLPSSGETPKFAQLYIYNTENEIQNRIHPFRYINMNTLCCYLTIINFYNIIISIFINI